MTIFPSLISARDESVIQKVQAANVIEANNTVSSPSMITSIVTKIVKVNDIEVAYKIFGRGEPLFLVPGFSLHLNVQIRYAFSLVLPHFVILNSSYSLCDLLLAMHIQLNIMEFLT
jgi:hypothetical protein